MCPTPLGRTQTRTAILVGPAILGLILTLITGNEGFIVLIGLYLVTGVILDILFYPRIIKWQPPWLTFVLGAGEFVILYVLAQILDIGLKPLDAVWFYWVSWTLAVWTRIVILPILSLTWIESGGEFRETGWSHAPENEPMPILAAMSEDGKGKASGRLAQEFSAVNPVPADVRELPSPSGTHRQPERLRR